MSPREQGYHDAIRGLTIDTQCPVGPDRAAYRAGWRDGDDARVTPKQPLAPRQQQMYDYVVAYIGRHGRAPTAREIRDHMGTSSHRGVGDMLDAIEKRGWIRRVKKAFRGIEIV